MDRERRTLLTLKTMGHPNNKITNGLSGGIYIADTNAYTGDWLAIQILADAKFAILTTNISDDPSSVLAAEASALFSATIPAGTTLFGKFTAITLHSGRIIAYNA